MSATAAASGDERADPTVAWLDDFFALYYRTRPVNATFIGVHDYDHLLPDASAAGLAATAAAEEALLQRVAALPDDTADAPVALDRRLAAGHLLIQRWERDSGHGWWGNPCWYTGEAVFGTIALFLRPFAPLGERVRAAIARLDAVPALLAQGRANLRHSPAAWIERAIDECDGALAFCRGGVTLLSADAGSAAPQLRAAAERAAAAFADFQGWLRNDLSLTATVDYACGVEALDLLIREGHYLTQDAAAIERYATEEFARLEAELAAGAAEFGARSPAEALAGLSDLHPSAGRFLARFSEVWDESKAFAESHGLVSWPDYPLRYVPQPAWAREAVPHLYFLPYRAPAPFDRAPVVEYLGPPLDLTLSPEEQERRLRAVNDSVIKANHVVHHGGIGHQIQNWHAFRAASRIGQIAATDCAQRIALFCGGTMAEGWACYVTDLMATEGFMTPLERYAQRHGRLRMAARALCDIRVHRGDWSLDEVAAFYHQRVGVPAEAAHAEAVKNSMFPGAALMYLVGTDTITALRRDLAARAGAVFDLRRFHDRLLSFGSVPVALIAAAMREEGNSSAF
ncbi:MAG TPA: DUF885 family protein [Thermomicrobiales bacterium]